MAGIAACHFPEEPTKDHSGHLLTAGHDDLTGADSLNDVVVVQQTNRGIDFVARAFDPDDDGRLAEIDGLAAEVFHDLEDLSTTLGTHGLDLDEGQFAHDRVFWGMFEAVNDVDELVAL